jgi:hypothetical protein
MTQVNPYGENVKVIFHNNKWIGQVFDSWTFDETSEAFVPPVPMPDNVKDWKWLEETQEWVENA